MNHRLLFFISFTLSLLWISTPSYSQTYRITLLVPQGTQVHIGSETLIPGGVFSINDIIYWDDAACEALKARSVEHPTRIIELSKKNFRALTNENISLLKYNYLISKSGSDVFLNVWDENNLSVPYDPDNVIRYHLILLESESKTTDIIEDDSCAYYYSLNHGKLHPAISDNKHIIISSEYFSGLESGIYDLRFLASHSNRAFPIYLCEYSIEFIK